jgi:hypothetical protein
MSDSTSFYTKSRDLDTKLHSSKQRAVQQEATMHFAHRIIPGPQEPDSLKKSAGKAVLRKHAKEMMNKVGYIPIQGGYMQSLL